MELFVPNKLKERVEQWRSNGYSCEYPVIAEIFEYAYASSRSDEKLQPYLRKAQFEALETYWFLRLVEKTPHIVDLYKKLYNDPADLLKALGITISNDDLIRLLSSGGLDSIFEKIKTDDGFAKKYKLETVRETLTLSYSSYILALAMGSGKTVLIGAIIATELVMSLEYREKFVKNALVFAPGKTILGALKEISDIPFNKILPPRLYKQFMSSVKITYTQDNEKGIPVIAGSSFNIIITNTEKIRIQKPTRRTTQYNLLNYEQKEKFEEQEEIANLRLQTIASLPSLAIFSDEAHHTYGQSLDKELKKVRKTVDYLAENTDVVVVVNTTGTPYHNRQMLRDVVFWYGLSEGIKDGILKEVKDSIYSYENITSEDFLNEVLEDFFKEYEKVTIYDGTKSKIAIYFPQTEDLERFKPSVVKKIAEIGLDPNIVLSVHNKSDERTKDLFNNRINDIQNSYRVYLLVNMGTEGWNCPSLFATALARKLKTSNNFVLQSASRCLRQIPNNVKKARIYLSKDNVKVLDSQLRETFGETLQILDMTRQELCREKLILRKIEITPMLIKKKIKRIVKDINENSELSLNKPDTLEVNATKTVYDIREQTDKRKILSERNVEKVKITENFLDIYEVSVDLAAVYRLELAKIYHLLNKLYPSGEIEASHLISLKQQVERQTRNYKVTEEEIEIALALVKPEGFEKEEINGKIVYVSEIIYHKDKADLLLKYEKYKSSDKRGISFHYSPYKMDSHPEKDFFIQLLEKLSEKPDDIQDVYFMGAITDSKKTDFLFEYKDKVGKWRTYTPDFILRKKNGKILIVEVKGEVFRDETKEMAIRELEGLNPEKLQYEVLVTKENEIGFENILKVEKWIYGESR